MFGQPGTIQVSTSVVNGADIVTPPASYVTIFFRSEGDPAKFNLYAKDSTGSVTSMQANAFDVIKS